MNLRSEDNSWELVLSLNRESRDQVQIARFGGRSLYPLSYFSGPTYKTLQLKFMPNLHLFMESLL